MGIAGIIKTVKNLSNNGEIKNIEALILRGDNKNEIYRYCS
jgi:hypothetical protein